MAARLMIRALSSPSPRRIRRKPWRLRSQPAKTIFGENRVQEAQAKFPALKAAHPELAAPSHRPAADQQGARGGSPVRRHSRASTEKSSPVPSPMKWQSRARRPALLHPGQHRRRAAEGRYRTRRDRRLRPKLCREELQARTSSASCASRRPTSIRHPHFALLREMAKRNNLSAAQHGHERRLRNRDPFGATHVRIGTAIFGQRCKVSYA